MAGSEPVRSAVQGNSVGAGNGDPAPCDKAKGGNAMKKSMKDEIKGKFHEVKGKVKEKAGKVTNNPDLKAEGHAEKLRGKVQKKLGQMEHVLDK
jgi:uncharacterized protein YjbJ (UPF0337 family)